MDCTRAPLWRVLMQYKLGVFLAVAALALTTGCGPADEAAGPGACNGKCDGISENFKDLYSDMKKIDLGDLVGQAAGLATDQVNDLLDEVPYSDIELSETETFGTADQAQRDLSIENLDALTAGLAARYGDKAFVTEINKLRAEHLRQNPGRVYGEAHFRLGVDLAKRFPFSADGFDGYLGFTGKTSVEARIVAPFSSETKTYKDAPLAALKSMRSFAMPRHMDHIKAMAPGETLALRAAGRVGFNLGAGIPIYLTTIGTAATLHAVFSAAAAVTLTGDLDVQLTRGAGQAAYVDVGVTGRSAQTFRLALRTRWGVEGLPEVEVAGYDLTNTAEKGLRDLLNKRLKVAEAAYSKSESDVRHTVARFAFDLNRRGEGLQQALYQAMRGDLRLAQALAQREDSGVTQLLDLTRDAHSVSSYLGAEFLTMKFYREQAERTGSVVITTEEQSQALLFDELEESFGFFWTTHGYTRRSVASLTSERGQPVQADHNLRVKIRDADSFTSRDQVLDHLDPLIAYFLGHERFVAKIANMGDTLQRYMDNSCSEPNDPNDWDEERAFHDCLSGLPNTSYAQSTVSAARKELELIIAQGLAGGFDAKFDQAADFARALFESRIQAQNGAEYLFLWSGPKSSLTVEYRLSAAALDKMLLASDGQVQFEKRVRDVLYHRKVWRGGMPAGKVADALAKVAKKEAHVVAMGAVFAEYAAKYRQLNNLSRVQHEAVQMGKVAVGDHGHLVVVDSQGEVALRSVAERKAALTAALFDALVDEADGIDDHEYSVVAYALLMGADPSEIELLVNFKTKDGEFISVPSIQKYGRSATASLIDAGEFDINSLVTAN